MVFQRKSISACSLDNSIAHPMQSWSLQFFKSPTYCKILIRKLRPSPRLLIQKADQTTTFPVTQTIMIPFLHCKKGTMCSRRQRLNSTHHLKQANHSRYSSPTRFSRLPLIIYLSRSKASIWSLITSRNAIKLEQLLPEKTARTNNILH